MDSSVETTNPIFEQHCLPFVGQWTRLVSTTNWDKGEIIHRWREAMEAADAPSAEYTDEAWSQRVGGVSPQHVGRLRRVFDRFAPERDQFNGLYWSHFQAALDWDDAEMWLEGATQNGWSVAKMRQQRWEAMGAPDDLKPRDEDVVSSEPDGDGESGADAAKLKPGTTGEFDYEDDPKSPAGPDFGDEDDVARSAKSDGDRPDGSGIASDVPASAPFESLPELPDDVQDAFDAFKISIVQHKGAQWSDISLHDMLRTLDALKQLAVAP